MHRKVRRRKHPSPQKLKRKLRRWPRARILQPHKADTAAPAAEATPDTAAVEEAAEENAAEASAAESATAAAKETVAKPAEAPAPSLSERIDEKFGAVVGFMAGILFVEVLQFEKVTELKEAASVGVPSSSWYWSSVPSSSPSITGS